MQPLILQTLHISLVVIEVDECQKSLNLKMMFGRKLELWQVAEMVMVQSLLDPKR